LCASWIFAAGFGPADPEAQKGAASGVDAETAQAPADPSAVSARPAKIPVGSAKKESKLRLTLDAALLADSNITNSSYDAERAAAAGGSAYPGGADKPKQGIGRMLAAAASLRLPVSKNVALAADADAYLLDYDGRLADDAGVTVSAGAEIKVDPRTTALIQATASDRWYGHILASSGIGARAQLRHQVAEGRQLTLSVDARVLTSDYSELLGGRQLGASATYDMTLNPNLTVGIGAYARREWLKGPAYANTDVGVFGMANRYLGPNLLVGVYGGVSRGGYDAADPYLSPDVRIDWRWYGGAYLTTRKPLFFGIFPNLSYTYSHTGSTVSFYRVDRHRARLGVRRSF